MPKIPISAPFELTRKNIVVWGYSRPHDYPNESQFIEVVLIRVVKQTPVEYWLFGVRDNNTLSELTSKISKANIPFRAFELMSLDKFFSKLTKAAIGLQFLSPDNQYSQGKSFEKILNYLSAGTVVVASKGAGHSFLKRNETKRNETKWYAC